MATSVPVPIARPTSAAASAGASLTPSPAIATTRPSLAEPLDDVALVVGQHLGLDPVDAEAAGDGLGGDPVVAGEHDDLDAVGAQRLERRGGGLLDGVGDGDDPGDLVVDADEDDGGAVGAEPVGLGASAALVSTPWPARNSALPSRTRRPSTRPDDALAGRGVEVGDVRDRSGRRRSAASTTAAPSGCSEARSTPAASRRSSSRSNPAAGTIVGDRRLALGEGAGLVDDEGVDLLHQLERLGVLDQHAEAGAAADADHDRHRRGQARAHRGRR